MPVRKTDIQEVTGSAYVSSPIQGSISSSLSNLGPINFFDLVEYPNTTTDDIMRRTPPILQTTERRKYDGFLRSAVIVVFVCLAFTLRFKPIGKRENESCLALPVLPLPFLWVPILTAAGGLISSLFGAHGFQSRRLSTVGAGTYESGLTSSRRHVTTPVVWTFS